MKTLLLAALLLGSTITPSASANPTTIISQAKQAPFELTINQIEPLGTTHVVINGTVRNLTRITRTVGSFDYQLIDRSTGEIVAESKAMVYKKVPANGRIGFRTYVETSDIGDALIENLQLRLVKFN